MRDVTVTRFVPRSPPTLTGMLTPEAMVEYEGSFEVRDVRTRQEDTLVTVGGGGVEFVLRFEDRADGLRYEQAGEAGPFDEMETLVTVAADEGGSTVTARSSVSLGLPISSLTDRIAAWKRRGELERALDAIVERC